MKPGTYRIWGETPQSAAERTSDSTRAVDAVATRRRRGRPSLFGVIQKVTCSKITACEERRQPRRGIVSEESVPASVSSVHWKDRVRRRETDCACETVMGGGRSEGRARSRRGRAGSRLRDSVRGRGRDLRGRGRGGERGGGEEEKEGEEECKVGVASPK